MNGTVFAPWLEETRSHWNQRPMRLQHHLHEHPALQLDALAALIESYPRSDYALVHTSRHGDGRARWREGEIAGTPGRAVIDAIAGGSLWLNLRQANARGPAYAQLLEQAYAEIAAQVPGFDAGALKMGILISSPQAQVHYHCDLPGQLLWQIHGRKRVWIYPAAAPCLQPEWLEDIAYTGFEFSLVYDPAFDRMAMVFDLEPGQMLTWPLNAPHRVENADCMNVSVTTEHWTPENRRATRRCTWPTPCCGIAWACARASARSPGLATGPRRRCRRPGVAAPGPAARRRRCGRSNSGSTHGRRAGSWTTSPRPHECRRAALPGRGAEHARRFPAAR